MNNPATLPTSGIKKLYISETVLFAINNIPEVDRTTLEKFLELVNATGTFGSLGHKQILTKMRLTLKYIPNVCPHSLLVLAELLEVPVSPRLDGYPDGSLAHLPASQVELNAIGINQAGVPLA